MKQTLTGSRLSCFRSCPRKHFIAYELGIRPAETGYVLRVGSAFHAALEAEAKGLNVEEQIGEHVTDPYDLALVAAMLHGYRERWHGEQPECVVAEIEFDLPLLNPATGAASKVWRNGGKIDRIVRLDDGRLALMEHKTTSRDFSPGAEYWMKLHLDEQLSRYVLAARALGYDVETVLYDVTRRPALRPLKATPEASRKYRADGKLYANQREEDETPEDFAARVAASIEADPDKHFARIEIARLDQDLDECAASLWQQQQAIRNAQRAGHWWRNPGACFEPFTCEYIAVCGNRDIEAITPPGFIRSSNVHPELGAATVEG